MAFNGPGPGPGGPRFWGPGPNNSPNQYGPRGPGSSGPPRQWGPCDPPKEFVSQGPPGQWGAHGPQDQFGPQGPPYQFGPRDLRNQWGPRGPPDQFGPHGQPGQWGPHCPPEQFGPRGPTGHWGPHGPWEQFGPRGPPNQWCPPSGPPGKWGSPRPNGPLQFPLGEGPMSPAAQWEPRGPDHSGAPVTSDMPPKQIENTPTPKSDTTGLTGTSNTTQNNSEMVLYPVAPPGVDMPPKQMSMCEMADQLIGSNGEPVNVSSQSTPAIQNTTSAISTMDTSMPPPAQVVTNSNTASTNLAQPPLSYNMGPPNPLSAPPPMYGAPPPSINNTAPSHQDPPPTYQDLPPTYQDPPPTYQNPPPTYQDPPPTYQDPPPTYQDPPPTYQDCPPTYQHQPPMYQNQPPMYQNQPPMYQNEPTYQGQPEMYQGQAAPYQDQNYSVQVPFTAPPSAIPQEPPVSAVIDPAIYEAATISAGPIMQPPPPGIASDTSVKNASSQPVDTTSNTTAVKLKSKSKANKIKIKTISAITPENVKSTNTKEESSDMAAKKEDDSALDDFYTSVETQIAEKKEQLKIEELLKEEEKKKEEEKMREAEERKQKARKLPSEIKGKVSIEVKNIFKPMGIYEFRHILQACGQINQYIMKKPIGEEYANATVTFSNIEEALRAARLLARLAIVDCKMTSVVPDFINNDAPPSRGMLSRDKPVVIAITKLLNTSCRTFVWDAPAKPPPEDEDEQQCSTEDKEADKAEEDVADAKDIVDSKKDPANVSEDTVDVKQDTDETEKIDKTDAKKENKNLANSQTGSAVNDTTDIKADCAADDTKFAKEKALAFADAKKGIIMSVSNIPDVAPPPPSMAGTNGVKKVDSFNKTPKKCSETSSKRRYRRLSVSSVSSESLDEALKSPSDQFGRAKRKRSRSVSRPRGETRSKSRSRSRSRDKRRSSRHRRSLSPARGGRRRRSRSYDDNSSRPPYNRRRGGEGVDSRLPRQPHRRDDDDDGGGRRRPLPCRREDGGREGDRHFRRDERVPYAEPPPPPYGDWASSGPRHPPLEECDRPGSRGSHHHHHHPAPVTIIRNASPEPARKKRVSKTPGRRDIVDDYNIKIIQYEKNITKSDVVEINTIFRGSKEPAYNDGWFLAIPAADRAIALYKLVNNYRLLDTKIRLTFLQKPSTKVKISETDLKGFESRIKKVFQLYNNHTKHLFKADISKVLDTYLYKLEPCPVKFCSTDCCPMYHSHKDRRRDPRKVTYNPVICTNLSRVSICPRGDSCKLAHNNDEVMMHPSMFLTDVCTLWYEERLCTSSTLCNNAHPESPDMFYHVAWSDLFVAGLHNTFFFIAGAIRNLHKLNHVTGMPILVVTDSEHVATNAPTMLEVMATRHGVKICSVITGSEDPRGSHIIVGTVKGLLLMFSERGVGPLRGLSALIVDDVASIFSEHSLLTSLVDLVVLVYNQLENPERLNKVILAHEIYEKDCSTAQELFSTEFTVVGKITEPSKDELAEVSSPSSRASIKTESAQSSEEEEFVLAADKSRSDKNPVAKKGAITHKKDHSDNDDWSDSSSNSSDRQTSSRCSKKSHSRSRSRASASHSSPSTSSKKTKADKIKSKKLKSDSDMSQLISKKKSDSPEKTSNNPPELTPQQFLSEEKALRAEHEQEYSVFVEVPEMHPDYEAKYEQFITCYRKRAGCSQIDAELEEKVWSTYWVEELEKLEKDKWQEKRKKLVEKYKQVMMKKKGLKPLPLSQNSDVQPSNSIPSDSVLMQSLAFAKNPPNLSKNLAAVKSVSSQSTPNLPLPPPPQTAISLPKAVANVDNFDVENAFIALDELCGRLGILGTALKGLIGMAREAGSSTIEAMKIFVDGDNITLIKMAIEKFKAQLKTSSQSTSAKLLKGIESAEKLLCHAEEQFKTKPSLVELAFTSSKTVSSPPKEVKPLDDIDINLIAKATLGKNPGEILSFIKSTLAFEGKSVNNEELTKLYLSVSALHMSLTLENSANMVSNSIPLNIPSSSQTANNILLTSMSEFSGHSSSQSLYSSSQSYTDTTNVIYSGPTNQQPAVSEWEQPTNDSMSASSPTQRHIHVNQTHLSPSQEVAFVDKDDSWFVQQVKTALSDPNITIELFNKQLATIFAKKPRNYKFSARDLDLASELQQLGTSSFTGEVFIITLKRILNM